jgi:hypothetical protein
MNLFLILTNALIIYGFNDAFQLYNFLFKADFDKTGIILSNNNNNYINIKYENIFEGDKVYPIEFNTFNYDEIDAYNGVITGYENTNFYFEALNIMSYNIYNYETNSLKVSLMIMDYKFQDMNNELILNLSFNGPVNYDGEYYLEIKDIIVVFSNKVIVDQENKTITVERFGNNFYLHFPSFKECLLYDFIIYCNSV